MTHTYSTRYTMASQRGLFVLLSRQYEPLLWSASMAATDAIRPTTPMPSSMPRQVQNRVMLYPRPSRSAQRASSHTPVNFRASFAPALKLVPRQMSCLHHSCM